MNRYAIVTKYYSFEHASTRWMIWKAFLEFINLNENTQRQREGESERGSNE